MKHLFAILLSITSLAVFAQDVHPISNKKLAPDFFISDDFCAARGLKRGQTENQMRIWNSDISKGAKLTRVADIRYYFSTAEEARTYLDHNIFELAENGDPLNVKLDLPGVTDLRIFREGVGTRDLNRSLGIENHMYYFLFTFKNYLAKVFVSSEMNLSVNDAAVYAAEAARRLKTAAK